MSVTFETKLSGSADGPTGIVVPPSAIEELGKGKKPAVFVNVNGYEYRSTVAVMGGEFMISFASAHRAASGIKAGDTISVTLRLDDQPREVELPDDLRAALVAADKLGAFEESAPSRKKEFVRQVVEAKAEDTRRRRIEKVVDGL